MCKDDFFNEIVSYRDKHKVVIIQTDISCCMIETPLFSRENYGIRICNQAHLTGEANAVDYSFKNSELAQIIKKKEEEFVEYIIGFTSGSKLELRVV